MKLECIVPKKIVSRAGLPGTSPNQLRGQPVSRFIKWYSLGKVELMHKPLRLSVFALLGGALATGVAYGQQAISAQSGMLHFVEGTVYANGQQVEAKFGQFPALKEGQELRTEDGRAEVLLTPGAFLRVSERSSIRMLSDRLSDTRVEVLHGSVMVECAELLKDNALSLVYQDRTIQLQKRGLYRLDTDPAQFRVYDGAGVVRSEIGQLTLRAGKATSLNGVLLAETFDAKSGDALYAWTRQRSSALSYASISAAQTLIDNGTTWSRGGWLWSPLLDEFTFVPRTGMGYSPFGWGFWSPVNLGYYYNPSYYGYAPGVAGKSGNTNPSAAAQALARRPVAPSNSGAAPVSGWQSAARSAGGYSGGSMAASPPMGSGGASPAVVRASGSGRATR